MRLKTNKSNLFTVNLSAMPAALMTVMVALFFGLCAAAQNAAPASPTAVQGPLRWFKGNFHTHSLWSDGDDYPDMVIDWYRTHGYNFLALSEHNVVMSGIKWTTVATNAPGFSIRLQGAMATNTPAIAYNKYVSRFGSAWVDRKYQSGKLQVRLKTFSQLRTMFDQPGHFLLMPSEEITTGYKNLPVHLNANNLKYLIKPKKGNTVLEILQKNVDAVLEQRRETGQPMLVQVNHPNAGWAIRAEDLMELRGERFIEVYNGHHQDAQNDGDETHVSIERMWDIAQTFRLAKGGEPLLAMAVDDAHNYHHFGLGNANPGRGWIMVHARSLTTDELLRAIEAGDYYASTGVMLHEATRSRDRLQIVIAPEPGVSYTTTFYGTRKGFDNASNPVLGTNGVALNVTRKYSASVGQPLAEVHGTVATYILKGDELYVRATISSSKLKANPYIKGEFEKAWTQPLVPTSRK